MLLHKIWVGIRKNNILHGETSTSDDQDAESSPAHHDLCSIRIVFQREISDSLPNTRFYVNGLGKAVESKKQNIQPLSRLFSLTGRRQLFPA